LSTIGGGYKNNSCADHSIIGGGSTNTIIAGTGKNITNFATIGGGYKNGICGGSRYGTIGGGNLNKVCSQ
jgi:hypothetical protein